MISKKSKFLVTTALIASAFMIGQPDTTIAQATKPAAESKPAVSTYTLDGGHSTIAFVITHSGVSKVHGMFGKVEGEIKFHPENPAASSIKVTVEPGSVNSNSKGRDKHLTEPDYFNVAQYATATFDSTAVSHHQGNQYKVKGDLKILDHIKPIEFLFTYNGEVQDKRGTTRIGADTSFTIDRTEWGLNEGVGALSADVTMLISLAATKD